MGKESPHEEVSPLTGREAAGRLPGYGPLPRPRSLAEARAVLKQERFLAPRVDLVEFEAYEFTAVCPRTGQPDFGKVRITYVPREWCIESKSLKFYLWAYREEGAFCETLAAQIADDIVAAVEPHYVEVVVEQNPRGGIGLKATARRGQPPA